VLEGKLRLRKLSLIGAGEAELPRRRTLRAGETAEFVVRVKES